MPYELKVVTDSPNRRRELIHNRSILKNDAVAMQAMVEVREERLGAIHQQDLLCLRKMREK